MTARAEVGERCVDPRLAGRAVVVLAGGASSEREVSLESGRAVRDALRRVAAQAPAAAPRPVEVEVAASGAWLLEDGARDPARALTALPRDAIYFLALHGGEGEGGTIQGLLEACGRAHTGAGVGASALCLDKHVTRLVLSDAGLAVAPGRWLARGTVDGREAERRQQLAGLGSEGWFVKPNSGGSSVGMTLARTVDEVLAGVRDVHRSGDDALVEARVPGIEATCAVLGDEALPPVEIRPRSGGFFDYGEKYDAGGAEELCPPRSLDETRCRRLASDALRAHRATGCTGYSRTDFIVPPGGVPVLLEVNTLPGLTPRSLLPLAAEAAGLDFPALCLRLLELALPREEAG